MKAAEVIAADRLTKTFGRSRGVRQISFTVERGEIFGFLGPNGAGKTTTIRMLLDLMRPTSGEVRIFGERVGEWSLAIRRRCGYLPGNFRAYDGMTGSEYLQFLASLREVSATRQQGLIDRFQLSRDHLARKIKHLSHGTLQKLGIVQAFFHRPELIVLDEPTIGLDPLMQEEFYRLLGETQNDGTTVFFSSHNLPEVENVCHRVAIVREGDLVALETLAGLKRKMRKRLRLVLSRPVADLELPGAHRIFQEGSRQEFLVQGPLRPLLERLADLPVEDLTFPEPDLEDVFLAYYRREG